MKPLSYLTEKFTESVIREMTRICDAAGGYNLSQGFPDFEADESIKNAACQAILGDLNQYPVTFGELKLRKAISKKAETYNGIKSDPESDITVTCGATEAMIASLMAIVNDGDEVIIFEPFYENYGPDAILSRAKPRYVRLYPPDWHYEAEELLSAFNKNTKAIIINTPHNPTGKVFSKAELEEISEACVKWDVIALTDEIYEHVLYDGCKHVSIASLKGMNDRTITINSTSKTYSVTGWRVGWAIADKKITKSIRKVHDFLTVGAATPLQDAAAAAIGMPESYYEKLRQNYEAKRDFFINTLRETGFNPITPKGAYYVMAQIGSLMGKLSVKDDFAFARKLIELTGVATVPGSSFYSDKKNCDPGVRFAFCKKESTLKIAGEKLARI